MGTIIKKALHWKTLKMPRNYWILKKVICAESFRYYLFWKRKKTKIYLHKNYNHFDFINSIKAFLGSTYYCYKCDKPYNNKIKQMQYTYWGMQTAQRPCILRKIKIKYTVKTVTCTVFTIIVLITTTTFARKFINVKLVLRLN